MLAQDGIKTIHVCREQHRLLHQLLVLMPTRTAVHEKSVLSVLHRVQMFLVAHLRIEDEQLYPLLEQSDNCVLSQKAKRYRATTGKLADVFDTFCTRWTVPGAIDADPTDFMDQWGEIAGLLLSRMSSEDEDLYAIGEQVLAAQSEV